MDAFSSTISAIINAQRQGYREVVFKTVQGAGSFKVRNLLQRLQREGYIEAVSLIAGSAINKKKIVLYKVRLKYNSRGKPAVQSFFRISSPSRRIFTKSGSFWQPQTSVGTLIVSTTFGIITDRTARILNVGGEIIGGIR